MFSELLDCYYCFSLDPLVHSQVQYLKLNALSPLASTQGMCRTDSPCILYITFVVTVMFISNNLTLLSDIQLLSQVFSLQDCCKPIPSHFIFAFDYCVTHSTYSYQSASCFSKHCSNSQDYFKF